MRFLRRGATEEGLDVKIERFWTWWADAKDAIAKDIPACQVARLAGEISSVAASHVLWSTRLQCSSSQVEEAPAERAGFFHRTGMSRQCGGSAAAWSARGASSIG